MSEESCETCNEQFELAKEGMIKMIKHRRACKLCKSQLKCDWKVDKKYYDAIDGMKSEDSTRLLGCLLVGNDLEYFSKKKDNDDT